MSYKTMEQAMQEAAEDLNGTVEDTSDLIRGDRLCVKQGPWTIYFQTADIPDATTLYNPVTYMYTRYLSRDGFRFSVNRSTFLSPLGKLIGLQDIAVGEAEFDRAFVIKSNDAAQARALFQDAKLRQLLFAQPSMHLQTVDDWGFLGGHFKENEDGLFFQVRSHIDDVERIKGLFGVFTEILNRLCEIGSVIPAKPDEPQPSNDAETLLRGARATEDVSALPHVVEVRPSTTDAETLPRPASAPDSD